MEIREVITGGTWMVMEPGVSRESISRGSQKVVRSRQGLEYPEV